MSQIDDKWNSLKKAGEDLGAPRGPERDAGYGGRVREYERGHIYWHPAVMRDGEAREVHGGILARYLAVGGPGEDSSTGQRLLGFPTSDEYTTAGLRRASLFEWGGIFWHGSHAVTVTGDAFKAWMGADAPLGATAPSVGDPLTPGMALAQGTVCYCDRGLVWYGAPASGAGPGQVASSLDLPLFGNPAMVGLRGGNGVVFTASLQPTGPSTIALIASRNRELLATLWKDRIVLRPVGSASRSGDVALNAVTADGGRTVNFVVPAGSTLSDRTLYDIVLRDPTGATFTLSPHAVYARSDWAEFGFLHATDLHVARRNDSLYTRLNDLGQTEAVRAYNNWNDRFRELIRYANHLHERGLLDVLLLTGDLVDYVYEDDDLRPGPGNFEFFLRTVLGKTASPDPAAPPAEELRIPILTVPGNHDYRPNPYRLYFDVDIPIFPDKTVEQYRGFNLLKDEARALEKDLPYTVGKDASIAMAAIDEKLFYYDRYFTKTRSFVTALGDHRVVMIDTGPDADPIDSTGEALKVVFGLANENEASFASSAPNLRGITPAHVALVRSALQGAGANGRVIVGMHAPPINPKGDEYAHFFRETTHPTVPAGHVQAYLARRAPGALPPHSVLSGSPAPRVVADSFKKDWVRTGTPHFKTGWRANLLDVGSTAGETDALLKLCSGVGVPRKADVILSGHGHHRVDYRLEWKSEQQGFHFFMDFYLENPGRYYASAHCMSPTYTAGVSKVVRVHVVVADGAPAEGALGTVNDRTGPWKEYQAVRVPPYATPLSSSSNARQWWGTHAPLVLQTAATGPLEAHSRGSAQTDYPGACHQGVRIFIVADNVIQRCHHVPMASVHAAAAGTGTLPWERTYAATVTRTGGVVVRDHTG